MVKSRSAILYYLLAILLNFPFMLYWVSLLSRDIESAANKSRCSTRIAIRISIAAFALFAITFAYLLSQVNETSMAYFGLAFGTSFFFGFVTVASFLYILVIAYIGLRNLQGLSVGLGDVVFVLFLFMLWAAALPFIQVKLNRLLEK